MFTTIGSVMMCTQGMGIRLLLAPMMRLQPSLADTLCRVTKTEISKLVNILGCTTSPAQCLLTLKLSGPKTLRWWNPYQQLKAILWILEVIRQLPSCSSWERLLYLLFSSAFASVSAPKWTRNSMRPPTPTSSKSSRWIPNKYKRRIKCDPILKWVEWSLKTSWIWICIKKLQA